MGDGNNTGRRRSDEWHRQVRARVVLPLTVQQDNGLLERQGMPDLQLAVGTLQDARRKEEHERCCFLDALEHALLCQVVGAVVVLHTSGRTGKRGGEKIREGFVIVVSLGSCLSPMPESL